MLKQSMKLSAAQFGSVEQNLTAKSKYSKSTSTKQYLGKIVNDRVKRSSSDEVVIKVQIMPVHSLIHNQLIRLALQKALTEYVDDTKIQQDGPYVVECGDEQMYWKVVSKHCGHILTVTKNLEKASVLYVIPDEETDDPYDFSFGWQGERLQDITNQGETLTVAKSSSKIMRFLEVPTFFFGHSPGPLKLKSELSAKDSKLCLYSQIKHDYFDSPSEFTPWLESNKVFFISSANKKSFIAVQRLRISSQEDLKSKDTFTYTTKCVGSQKEHNERNTWMLFRLQSCANAAQAQPSKQITLLEKSQEKMKQKLNKFLETP